MASQLAHNISIITSLLEAQMEDPRDKQEMLRLLGACYFAYVQTYFKPKDSFTQEFSEFYKGCISDIAEFTNDHL